MTNAAQDYIATETRLGAHNYKPLDVVLTRGEGVWVWDVDGTRYLDCLSAYSAVNQGHCHPKIREAMIEQSAKLTLTSRAFHNDQLGLFYEEITAITNSHKVLPMNSGAEAVESAIKAVRKWGYEVKGVAENQAEIIVCGDNFHGRTLGVVGFSTDPTARGGFGPFAPGFKVVPFGDLAAFEEGDYREHRGLSGRTDPGRSRRHHPARGLFPGRPQALHGAQHHPHPRRDPDRPRAHRQAPGRRARGYRSRCHSRRQGPVGRLLPGLRRALEHRGARRPAAGPAWLDVRRQSAWLRHRPRLP